MSTDLPTLLRAADGGPVAAPDLTELRARGRRRRRATRVATVSAVVALLAVPAAVGAQLVSTTTPAPSVTGVPDDAPDADAQDPPSTPGTAEPEPPARDEDGAGSDGAGPDGAGAPPFDLTAPEDGWYTTEPGYREVVADRDAELCAWAQEVAAGARGGAGDRPPERVLHDALTATYGQVGDGLAPAVASMCGLIDRDGYPRPGVDPQGWAPAPLTVDVSALSVTDDELWYLSDGDPSSGLVGREEVDARLGGDVAVATVCTELAEQYAAATRTTGTTVDPDQVVHQILRAEDVEGGDGLTRVLVEVCEL